MGRALRLLTLLSVLAGCQTLPTEKPDDHSAQGRVDAERLPVGDEGRYELSLGQSSDGRAGQIEHMPLPSVPERWLEVLETPLRIELLAVIDPAGMVAQTEIDVSEASSRCQECAVDFEQAIALAAKEWRLAPLEISGWIDVDTDNDGEPDAVRREVIERRPYSVRLALTFRRVDGRLSVVASDPNKTENF